MTNTTGRVRARRLMAAALSTFPRKVVTCASGARSSMRWRRRSAPARSAGRPARRTWAGSRARSTTTRAYVRAGSCSKVAAGVTTASTRVPSLGWSSREAT